MLKNKFNFPKLFQSWRLTAAVVSAALVIAGGVGVFAYQQYAQSQQTAADLAQSALEIGQERVDELTARIADLELAINNALEIQAISEGETLDEAARDELSIQIESGKKLWVEQKTKLIELENALATLRSLQSADGVWPASATQVAQYITEASKANWNLIVSQVSDLGSSITSVQAAQEKWQAEEDRVAAEIEAAKVAAIQKAAAESLARQATDTTSIAAPPSSSEPVDTSSTPSPEMLAVQSYFLTLATNVTFLWDPDLCDPGFVCGKALPSPLNQPIDFLYASMDWGYSGAPVTPEHAHVFILLDSSFDRFYYSTGVGRSILVHEAAHARQWLKYGKDIITANETFTGLVGIPAVERMADCATIAKLGYSTGAYTSSCTPSELEAAATLW